MTPLTPCKLTSELEKADQFWLQRLVLEELFLEGT